VSGLTAGAVVLVCLAGGAGAVLRVLVDGELRVRTGRAVGTGVVNVVGSLVIGLVTGLLPASGPSVLLAVVATGFCGGLTSFGTAVVEVLRLAEARRPRAALAAAAVTVVVSTAAAGAGLVLGRALA
jgi:fluoride exporter